MTCIFLLTGWGIKPKALQPLVDELTRIGYRVTLGTLPETDRADHWIPLLAKQLPAASYWVGWSLGGQLVAELTKCYASQCLGLVTLASNPCFKAKASWPCAMSREVFEDFVARFKADPTKTLQRFSQLVVQGCANTRPLLKALSKSLSDDPLEWSITGLTMLEQLDTMPILQQTAIKQLHLLAGQDALIPSVCAQHMQSILGESFVELWPDNGHAFPIANAFDTAHRLHQFFCETS